MTEDDTNEPIKFPPPQTGNPYFDAASGSLPPELLSIEQAMYPYRNDLPGVSSVNAARTLSQAISGWRAANSATTVLGLVILAIVGAGIVASLSNVIGF